MASLKALQKKVPGAETVAGRVTAFVAGKHVDLGEYVGDGSVVLTKDGDRLMNPPKADEKPVLAKGLNVSIDELEV